jgi:hypothetical protein
MLTGFYNILVNTAKRTNLLQMAVISFLLKLLLVFVFSNPTPISDFGWYYQQAKNVSLLNGIIEISGKPTT